MRILNYSLAVAGVTQVLEIEFDGSDRIQIGLDGRMDSPGGEAVVHRQLAGLC